MSVKKIEKENEKKLDQKPGNKKNSLFDDSFFEDDEDNDDDDFNFEDDENEDDDNEQEEPKKSVKQPISATAPIPSLQNKAGQIPQAASENSTQQKMHPAPLEEDVDNNLAQEVQFRLGCEIGQVLIPYENLQNLNIGSVVDFNNTLQTLYISVNNVRVGEGMLVDIDGKIGIKITRWYGKI